MAGVPAEQVLDLMNALEDRPRTLETSLQADLEPVKLRLHPCMATTNKDSLQTLLEELNRAERMDGPKDTLRGLIDHIFLHPNPQIGTLSVELDGALAGLPALADAETPIDARGHSTLGNDVDTNDE